LVSGETENVIKNREKGGGSLYKKYKKAPDGRAPGAFGSFYYSERKRDFLPSHPNSLPRRGRGDKDKIPLSSH
jgi:hypothetical protein